MGSGCVGRVRGSLLTTKFETQMNTDRIKEIQLATAHPESGSVYTALLKVWNETKQEQLNICGVSISALTEILKSDSVYTILRFGVKSPSKSGMDDCDDNDYYELYQLVCELRKH